MSFKKVPTQAKINRLNAPIKARREMAMIKNNQQQDKQNKINRRFSLKRYTCLMALINRHRFKTLVMSKVLGL